MTSPRRPAPFILLAAAGAAVVLLALLLLLVPVPDWLRCLLPAALAAVLLLVAAAGARRAARTGAALEARLAARDRDVSQLRHDLRGILSPAMLTADRLTTSADPVVRRAGETMVATVERAEQRLRNNPAPPAGG